MFPVITHRANEPGHTVTMATVGSISSLSCDSWIWVFVNIPSWSTMLEMIPTGSMSVPSGRLMVRFSTAGRSCTHFSPKWLPNSEDSAIFLAKKDFFNILTGWFSHELLHIQHWSWEHCTGSLTSISSSSWVLTGAVFFPGATTSSSSSNSFVTGITGSDEEEDEEDVDEDESESLIKEQSVPF